MRVLLTRPEPEASRSYQALQARGYRVASHPLMKIERLPFDASEAASADAFVLTSQRAVFALPNQHLSRPVFTTGSRTADAARERGFQSVFSANGDWHDLASLILRNMPKHSRLWHPSGERQRGSLATVLSNADMDYRQTDVYSMRDVTVPPELILTWLARAEPGSVMFYSPATAAIWSDLKFPATRHRAVCMSQACATMLRASDWARIVVADLPNEEALWQCLETIG